MIVRISIVDPDGQEREVDFVVDPETENFFFANPLEMTKGDFLRFTHDDGRVEEKRLGL